MTTLPVYESGVCLNDVDRQSKPEANIILASYSRFPSDRNLWVFTWISAVENCPKLAGLHIGKAYSKNHLVFPVTIPNLFFLTLTLVSQVKCERKSVFILPFMQSFFTRSCKAINCVKTCMICIHHIKNIIYCLKNNNCEKFSFTV